MLKRSEGVGDKYVRRCSFIQYVLLRSKEAGVYHFECKCYSYFYFLPNNSHEKTKVNSVLVCLSILSDFPTLSMGLCPLYFFRRFNSLRTGHRYTVLFLKRLSNSPKRLCTVACSKYCSNKSK